MALSDEYIQNLFASKDQKLAMIEANKSNAVVAWAVCDGALIIYDDDDPPEWFKFARDEDGNSMGDFTSSELGQASMTVPGKR